MARLLSRVKKSSVTMQMPCIWALVQDMPTGSYTRRLAENEFKPKSSVRMAIEWLEFVGHKEGIHIRHR